MDRDANKRFVESLSRSQIYQDYERAFSQTTGLPLTLRPVEPWHLVHKGKKYENPFCTLMAETNKSCAACLEVQQKIAAAAGHGPRTVRCFAGLCDTGVPVSVGDEVVGYLQTGQIHLKKPTKKQFNRKRPNQMGRPPAQPRGHYWSFSTTRRMRRPFTKMPASGCLRLSKISPAIRATKRFGTPDARSARKWSGCSSLQLYPAA